MRTALGKTVQVEDLAKRALEIYQSTHPLNLLGRFCFRVGQYAQGEMYFSQADPNPRSQERKIDDAIKEISSTVERRKAAAYLLETDADKYAWAKRYL